MIILFKKPKDLFHWHFPFDNGEKVDINYDEEFAEPFEFPEFENDVFKRNIKSDPLLDDDEWKY